MALIRLNNQSISSVTALPSAVPSSSMVDVWRLTSSYSTGSNSASTITGWERADDATFSQIGTGMSESSGHWTFPSTGKYLILVVANFNSKGNDSNYNEVSIHGTQDNFTTSDFLAGNSDDIQSGTNERGATSQFAVFNCTDTSTHKIRFIAFTQNDVDVYGDTNGNRTHALFFKL